MKIKPTNERMNNCLENFSAGNQPHFQLNHSIKFPWNIVYKVSWSATTAFYTTSISKCTIRRSRSCARVCLHKCIRGVCVRLYVCLCIWIWFRLNFCTNARIGKRERERQCVCTVARNGSILTWIGKLFKKLKIVFTINRTTENIVQLPNGKTINWMGYEYHILSTL